MIKTHRIALIIAVLLVTNIIFSSSLFQDKYSEDRQIAEWKHWIKRYPPSKGSLELKLVHSFPAEQLKKEDIYLWGARKIARDRNGNIYVLDSRWKSVFKFDSRGSFVKRHGRIGQGPGEFMNPLSMCVTDNHVIVSDTNKYEMQIYDLELNFKKSVKVFKAYIEIAANSIGKIYAAPVRINNASPLIDVINDDGQLLFSFGKAMFGSDNHWQIPNFVKIDLNDKNEIFIAFQYFPTVCKYDDRGRLIAVYKIDNSVMKEREKYNLKSINSDKTIFWPVIYAIRASKPGFFIMQPSPYMQILEYDAKGKMVNDYWSLRSYDYSAEDFIAGENEEHDFLLMKTSPECSIEVFRPKTITNLNERR